MVCAIESAAVSGSFSKLEIESRSELVGRLVAEQRIDDSDSALFLGQRNERLLLGCQFRRLHERRESKETGYQGSADAYAWYTARWFMTSSFLIGRNPGREAIVPGSILMRDPGLAPNRFLQAAEPAG